VGVTSKRDLPDHVALESSGWTIKPKMSSGYRDGVSPNRASSTDMRYEMGFGAALFPEIQKEHIHEDHG
jgi:hypothetical protein